MLTPNGRRGLEILLTCGTSLCIFPYTYDPSRHSLLKGSRRQWRQFLLHKYLAYGITAFSGGRLLNAWSSGRNFPISFKVLNLVFLLAHLLTSIAMYQFSTREQEIRQFFNVLLNHALKEDAGRGRYEDKGRKIAEKGSIKDKTVQKMMDAIHENDLDFYDRKGVQRLSQYVLLGLLILAVNPSVHAKLVEESPCTPNFLISTVLPTCSDFHPQTLPLLYKIPWMIPEYYFTTVMFSSWSFNWVAIFLGMSWMVNRLRGLIKGLLTRKAFNLRAYREAEVSAIMMNDAFVLYLSTFPYLLFAIVSILILGVIRIWHTDPGSNLMFPLCGVRCSFEAITPLAVAGEMNNRNMELKTVWKGALVGSGVKNRLGRVELKSMNGVRVTAGSLYTFENSIVISCLNNCMLLTLNMLVMLKQQDKLL